MIRRRCRQTGTFVTVYGRDELSFDDSELPWWTFCDEHERLVGHETRRAAESWAASPMTWCEVCNGNEIPEDDDGKKDR